MQPTTHSHKLNDMRHFGADWWNDSCDLAQLSEAVSQGATGATSNPVIVEAAVNADQDRWLPCIRELAKRFPQEDEEAITWRLISEMGRQAAHILRPVYDKTGGKKGYLSLQVNPKFHLDTDKMYTQAKQLASLAPNIAIKIPATRPGLEAMERLTAKGIAVNVTVSFSVSQAIAAAEAIERGLASLKAEGKNAPELHPYVTIMVGRVGDHLNRIAESQGIGLAKENLLILSGVYVFKQAARIFKKRNFQSTLLAAAYRHELQWSEIIGGEVLQSIPFDWWKQFCESDFEVRETLWDPEDPSILEMLQTRFEDFNKVYLEGGLPEEEFESFGATQDTIAQFIEGYERLVSLVKRTMRP